MEIYWRYVFEHSKETSKFAQERRARTQETEEGCIEKETRWNETENKI